MSYALNAEGDNGVRQATNISNLGITAPTSDPTILLVRGDVPSPYPNPYIDIAGIQASGNNNAPGVVGYNFGGIDSTGVGVAGVSKVVPVAVGRVPSRTFPPIDPFLTVTAGVYGYCQAGPGVLGQGSDATNPHFQGAPPIAAGTGVVGLGGKSAAAFTSKDPPTNDPALPGGAGVVGLGGSASMPAANVVNGVGVVGIGSPLGNNSYPGRGGVFGSTGYAGQLRLIPGPPTKQKPLLPVSGEVGDLYITATAPVGKTPKGPGPITMFLCISSGVKTVAATWVPLLVGAAQTGGTTPTSP